MPLSAPPFHPVRGPRGLPRPLGNMFAFGKDPLGFLTLLATSSGTR